MVILIGLNTEQTQIFLVAQTGEMRQEKTLSAFNRHCHDFVHFANVQ